MNRKLSWLSAFCLTTVASGTAAAETTGATTGSSTPASLAITAPEDGAFVESQFDVTVMITQSPSDPISAVNLSVDGDPTDQSCTITGAMCLFSLELEPGEHQIEAVATPLGSQVSDVINVNVVEDDPIEGTDGGATATDSDGSDEEPAADDLEGGAKGCSVSGRPAALPALALLLLCGVRRRR